MVLSSVPAIIFLELSEGMQKKACGIQSQTSLLRFKALFGITPLLCQKLWEKISSSLYAGSKPCHLLWALLKLRTYATDEVCTVITGACKKTYQKWTWIFIQKLSEIENVSLIYI